MTDAERRHIFIEAVKRKDFSHGGNLNLCDLTVLKSLWKERYPDVEITGISEIQHHFRDRHIRYLFWLKSSGYTKEQLLAKGFRWATISKYWDNRELAERITGRQLP